MASAFVSCATAALARCISGNVDPALEGEERGDEDDLPVTLLEHLPPYLPCQDELGRQVHLEYCIPVLVGVGGRRAPPNRAGVVDEDVDRRAFAQRRDEAVYRGAIAEVARVSLERRSALLDLPSHVAPVRLERRAHPEDVGPRIGERERDGLADTPTAAGDENGRACECAARHGRQSTRIFIASTSASRLSKTDGSRSSGSTALMRRSSGSAPEAMRSIARS